MREDTTTYKVTAREVTDNDVMRRAVKHHTDDMLKENARLFSVTVMLAVCVIGLVVFVVFLLMGCGGGVGGSGAEPASETLYLCSMTPALDETVRRAVVTIQLRLTEDIWDDTPPRGMLSAQRTVTHEGIHALTGRVDHVEAPGNLMHKHHAPFERVLGPGDVDYITTEQDIAYTEDMGLCDVEVALAAMDPACPPHATGCYFNGQVTLNERYRWYMP